MFVLIQFFSLGVTAEELLAKIYRKCLVEGDVPKNHFCRDSLANECLITLSLTVSIQRNFLADFVQAKCDFRRKTAVLSFRALLGSLGETYDDHLRLGQRVIDFLLVLILNLFC